MTAVALAVVVVLLGAAVCLIGSYVSEIRRGVKASPWRAGAWRNGEWRRW
jgi:hypothetical protein